MNTKRFNILAGTILGGALLLGTAGLVFAQDPTTSPSPSATSGMSGCMMGGQGQNMMGRQGQGMMGGGGMGAGQMPDMTAMHAAMGQDGTCDPKLMQSMHQQYQSTR
jgi:hypothetical protein